jgi:uncharacterized protein (TIGR00645 family)
MRDAWFVAREDLRHALGLAQVWVWMFVMPLLLAYIVGSLMQSMASTIERIALYAPPDSGFLAGEMARRLEASGYHVVRLGDAAALQQLVTSMGYKTTAPVTSLNETIIMLVVLALIDVVMISNLLIMVIVGGYETFVSRLDLEGHRDQPEWLSHVNASVLKVKLATAIIGISSIHLLKTFINAENYSEKTLMWQTLIHGAFLFSAMAIAATDRILSGAAKAAEH